MTREGLISTVGPVMQLAFTPRDFDAAVAHWTKTMGVGPFFYIDHAPIENVVFRGAPSNVDFGLAISSWGDIQIELIRQHNNAPSIYNSAPWAREGNALHHVCLMTDDIRKAENAVDAGGGDIVVRLDVVGGGRAIYADMGGGEGLVEVLEPGPGGAALFDQMRAAAAEWDGADPFRPLG